MTLISSNHIRLNLNTLVIWKNITRTYYKKPFFYDDKYMGGFDYHDQNRYPRRLSNYKEEELLDEIHSLRKENTDDPSPFHIVTRVRSMSYIPWTQKVTLRRLNLHSIPNGDCVVVPNTPQFNSLLFKVKHLIRLKPAKFADGKIPTEDDIGALKVCPFTGTVKVDEKLRMLSKRLTTEKPLLWQGNHLRVKINTLVGHTHNYFNPRKV